VKPFAIVDDTKRKSGLGAFEQLQAAIPQMSVIKRGLFDYRKNPYADETLAMPDKNGYLDELNRLRAEIAAAKAELRSLGRLFEEEEALPGDDTEIADEIELQERRAKFAREEAERLLAEAKAKVAEMQAYTDQECRRLMDEARSTGYLEGFDKGFAEAQAEFTSVNNPKVRELESLLENVSSYHEEMLSQNERQLVELTVTVCEKILGREIEADSRAIVTMLYKVLDENRREQNMRITVSPELMPAEAKVAADIRKLIAQTAPDALLTVDEEAPPGTLVVETSKGITDLSVDTQLNNIKDMLLEP
jgi:flagellar assembly protein FliH